MISFVDQWKTKRNNTLFLPHSIDTLKNSICVIDSTSLTSLFINSINTRFCCLILKTTLFDLVKLVYVFDTTYQTLKVAYWFLCYMSVMLY